MPNKKYSDFIPHDQPPTFDELVGIIEKNFRASMLQTGEYTPAEVEESWQRYKALNHLYQDESAEKQQREVNDYKEVLSDHNRLVRELDVIINGDNAAEQASLCDIVAQVRKEWKGQAVWVKATKRLPVTGDYYYCKIDTKQDSIDKAVVEFFNGWFILDGDNYGEEAEVIEWLDETSNAVQSGKEDAVLFGQWAIDNNWVIGHNNLWWLNNESYKGTGITTSQLYEIYKQQNK